MRINELVKTGERTEQRIIHHDAEYADDGSIITEAWDETVTVQVPVMEAIYRDATTEELSELVAQESTPAEKRELAYDTVPCIDWDGAMLTVTQAAQQWAYYAAEGNTEKTDALTALIAAAKQSIRGQYPDEEG